MPITTNEVVSLGDRLKKEKISIREVVSAYEEDMEEFVEADEIELLKRH